MKDVIIYVLKVNILQGSYTMILILAEKVLKFAKQFFRPGNILENTDKRSGKWLKARSFF